MWWQLLRILNRATRRYRPLAVIKPNVAKVPKRFSAKRWLIFAKFLMPNTLAKNQGTLVSLVDDVFLEA